MVIFRKLMTIIEKLSELLLQNEKYIALKTNDEKVLNKRNCYLNMYLLYFSQKKIMNCPKYSCLKSVKYGKTTLHIFN